jgi:hypothetical protein
VERDKPKKSESVGQTAAVAMEIKKRGFNFFIPEGTQENKNRTLGISLLTGI